MIRAPASPFNTHGRIARCHIAGFIVDKTNNHGTTYFVNSSRCDISHFLDISASAPGQSITPLISVSRHIVPMSKCGIFRLLY